MTLDDLTDDLEAAYEELPEELSVALDEETRQEMAMLRAVLETDDESELVRRAVHLLFQTAVDSGKIDFHLRSTYDVTYDEYLSGMTYEEMTGGSYGTSTDDGDRRYQF